MCGKPLGRVVEFRVPRTREGGSAVMATSPGSSPGAAYPLRATTVPKRSGASRSACSDTAAPCEKPRSATEGASLMASSSQRRRGSPRRVCAVESVDRMSGSTSHGPRRGEGGNDRGDGDPGLKVRDESERRARQSRSRARVPSCFWRV